MNTETQEPQADNKSSESSKLLLAPLAMYAVVAFLIAGLIITTTIIMSRDLSSINEQVATAEAHIASLDSETNKDTLKPKTNQLAPQTESPVKLSDNNRQITTKQTPVSTAATAADMDTNQESSSNQTADDSNAGNSSITANNVIASDKPDDVRDIEVQTHAYVAAQNTDTDYQQRLRQRRDNRNSELLEQDKAHLEKYKKSQANQITFLKNQLAQQQERINELEQRYQKNYELRATSIERIQKHRQQFFQRM